MHTARARADEHVPARTRSRESKAPYAVEPMNGSDAASPFGAKASEYVKSDHSMEMTAIDTKDIIIVLMDMRSPTNPL
jgi:hypothetical protein